MPVVLNDNVFEDKKLYGIIPYKLDKFVLGAILNSTLTRLFIEFTSRQLTGAQTIADIDVIVVENAPILSPQLLSKEVKTKLYNLFRRLCNSDAESIFKEIASTPEEVSLDKVKPDRRELDKIIMGEILGLSEEEQLEVYRAVVDLVKSRIDKAKSVKKTKRKTREGIDIDAFTESVMNALGEDNFGKFYREKILSRDDLRTITLPRSKGKVKVEQELHGWVVRIGRSTVECASKEEAEYIAIFAEMGEREVQIPEDTDYLADVMPQFLEHKRRVDEVLESHLASVPSAKAREKLRNSVWRKIING